MLLELKLLAWWMLRLSMGSSTVVMLTVTCTSSGMAGGIRIARCLVISPVTSLRLEHASTIFEDHLCVRCSEMVEMGIAGYVEIPGPPGR